MEVLEPSAGTGNLIAAIRDAVEGARVYAVEINPTLCEHLVEVVDKRCGDFLQMSGDVLGRFDRIVMNPPFDHGADIKHVEHARQFLAEGGRLVAIMANGPRQREKFEPDATAWIDLLAGTFIGTSARAAIVVIES
jgi:16S rRNA G1207 methylase RsmC